MKTLTSSPSPWQWAGWALALLVFPVVTLAEEPADSAAATGAKAAEKTAEKLQGYKANPSEVNKADVKAALEQIDAELEHLDQLAEAAPDAQQRAETKLRYDILKERRNDLKREFTRARYEAFKADLQAEMDKVSAWAKEKFSGNRPVARPAATVAGDAVDSVSKRKADAPTDSITLNEPQVRTALARLDTDIEMLAARIDALSDHERKAQLNRRLRAYRDRRNELSSQFRQDRYAGLAADVKAEWNQLLR